MKGLELESDESARIGLIQNCKEHELENLRIELENVRLGKCKKVF